MEFRRATARDIDAIAALHADSWRAHYRGAYSDAFLDGDVFADRQQVWTARLLDPDPRDDTVVVESGGDVVGFVHTILDHDAELGALLDNLHVVRGLKRTGIGTRLMARSAAVVIDRGVQKHLYLEVLEGNVAAQAFYTARGGTCVGRDVSEAPGGGSVAALRFSWPDPTVLLRSDA